MSALTELQNPELSNEDFWSKLADFFYDSGTGLDEHTAAIRALLLNKERILDVHARFAAMSDDEIAWMGAKKRRGKKIRIYRAAPVGKIAGFRFHTNIDHAINDLTAGTPHAHFFTGEVDVDSIIFRIQTSGSKLVFVSPDRVRALKVQELFHRDAVDAAQKENLQTVDEAADVDDNLDVAEEQAEA